MNRRIVRKSATELVQYQLKLVQRIEHGKPVTYPGYAHIKPKSPRPTILTEGMIGEVRSYSELQRSAQIGPRLHLSTQQGSVARALGGYRGRRHYRASRLRQGQGFRQRWNGAAHAR